MPIEPGRPSANRVGDGALASTVQPPATMLAAPENKRNRKEPKCRKPGWRRTASKETAPDSRVQIIAA